MHSFSLIFHLRQFLFENTPLSETNPSKPKAVIAFYIHARTQICTVTLGIYKLFKLFNYKYEYPIIIFHSGVLTGVTPLDFNCFKMMLRKNIIKLIEFHLIQDYLLKLKVNFSSELEDQFWLKYVQKHPRFVNENVRYYMRVGNFYDLNEKIEKDLFQWMEDSKIKYAYRGSFKDNINFTYTLIPYVYLYANHKKLLPMKSEKLKFLNDFPPLKDRIIDIFPKNYSIKDYSFEIIKRQSARKSSRIKRWIDDVSFDWSLNMYVFGSNKYKKESLGVNALANTPAVPISLTNQWDNEKFGKYNV